jgi:hypothetical protein
MWLQVFREVGGTVWAGGGAFVRLPGSGIHANSL